MVRPARAAALLLGLLAACSSDPPAHEAAAPAVPGVETAVAAVERLRDVLRAPGVVTPDGATPEARDARNDLVAAEARLRLAEQQTERARALAPGNVAPRKDLEAALAEETSARAAAARARQVVDALGGVDPPAGERRGPWVVARVPQERMPAVVAEAPASFTADVEGRPVVPGVVDAAPTYVDSTSRTAPVRIRTDDAAHRLLPGVSGSVAIEVGPLRDAVVVPEVAVVYDDHRPLVFVDDGHGGFTATPVRLGVIRAGRVEVAEGVAAGTRVATTGAASLLSATRLGTNGAD
jgi:multidrug efflux pump subunit AcrA (membrane-fusion protein)